MQRCCKYNHLALLNAIMLHKIFIKLLITLFRLMDLNQAGIIKDIIQIIDIFGI